jgi:hypothetical protein
MILGSIRAIRVIRVFNCSKLIRRAQLELIRTRITRMTRIDTDKAFT